MYYHHNIKNLAFSHNLFLITYINFPLAPSGGRGEVLKTTEKIALINEFCNKSIF